MNWFIDMGSDFLWQLAAVIGAGAASAVIGESQDLSGAECGDSDTVTNTETNTWQWPVTSDTLRNQWHRTVLKLYLEP